MISLGRIGVRWLLLGVGLSGLLLPVLAILALDAFDLYLVQETERRLQGQGAVIGQAYRLLWSEEAGVPLADPRPPGQSHRRYVPYDTAIASIDDAADPIPESLPVAQTTDAVALRAGKRVERLLVDSQLFNLSGVRILDSTGCVVATSRSEAGLCLTSLTEVAQAMRGKYHAVLRTRVSDEPPPAFGSMSRRGQMRVFTAQPVWNGGNLIGLVAQSRTAETSTELLWKQRRGLVVTGSLIILIALGLSLGFARTIERPLRIMSSGAEAIADGRTPPTDLSNTGGPRELRLLGQSLAAMTAKLRVRNQYITDFVSTVGHELKSPLTSISGAAELLIDDFDKIPQAQRQRFLQNIRAAANRTTKLAQRLLDLARAENPELVAETAKVELDRVAADLVERYPRFLSVTVEPSKAAVAIARDQLDSVLGNLLDNALRYRQLRDVQLSLGLTAENQLRIEVANDGPMISANNQERLFERFFTTERDAGGTGLGLSIVKAIAESRGGSVSVASDETGTRFSVVL